jgi:hypothetical protein
VTNVEDALPQGEPVSGASPGHESNRIRLRGLLIFSVALIVTIVLVQGVLGLVMERLARPKEQPDALYPGHRAIEVDRFPNPRLQQNPADDLARMKAEEYQRITTYGWVDRKAGIARIPVDRAMDILAKSGLPKVAAPPPVPGAPPNTSIPPGTKREMKGESGSEGQPNK